MTHRTNATEAEPLLADGDAPTVAVATVWRWRLGVGLVHGMVLGIMAVNALFRPQVFPGLYLWHAARIEHTFDDPWWDPGQAQFLWHAAAKLSNALVGADDPRVGAAIASVGAYIFFGMAIFEVLRRRDDGSVRRPFPAAGASLVIALLEAPSALLGWKRIADPDTSFMSLYLPYLPTSVTSLGPNVLLVWVTSRLLVGELSAGVRRWVPVMVVFAAFAKPNLVAPLSVTGVALAWWGDRQPQGPPWRRAGGPALSSIVRLVAVPAVAVTLLQSVILQFLNPPVIRGTWVVRPLDEMSELGALRWEFWLVLIFPLLAVALVRTRLVADPAVALLLGSLAIGFAASLLLARTGSTEFKGDVLQLCQASTAMLVVYGVRRLWALWEAGRLPVAVLVALGLVLVPYLAAGLDAWRCHAGVSVCYEPEDAPSWPLPPGVAE